MKGFQSVCVCVCVCAFKVFSSDTNVAAFSGQWKSGD